jgi:hypothetical protein
MQSPLEASVQELCNARLVEEFAHMDENKPPVPPSDFLLRSAFERTSAYIDPPPEPCGNDPCDGSSAALYYRDEAEVREGFLIALRAMGLAGAEQHPEPSTPPARGAKP